MKSDMTYKPVPKSYVDDNIAVELSRIGYDWDSDKKLENNIPVPTYSEIIQWFRENMLLDIFIGAAPMGGWAGYTVAASRQITALAMVTPPSDTWQEAEEKMIVSTIEMIKKTRPAEEFVNELPENVREYALHLLEGKKIRAQEVTDIVNSISLLCPESEFDYWDKMFEYYSNGKKGKMPEYKKSKQVNKNWN